MLFRHRTSIAAALIAAGLANSFLIDLGLAQRPKPIPAGDCNAMVAATGGKGIWYGEYAGRYEDIREFVYPLAGRGCFRSEYACRRWLHEMLSLANGWSAIRHCPPYKNR